MFVMGCVFELQIQEATSLKDKRRVIKGLMEKMRRQFQMSTVETGLQDVWEKSRIGCCYAANYEQDLENKLERIVSFVEQTPQVVILVLYTDTMKVD